MFRTAADLRALFPLLTLAVASAPACGGGDSAPDAGSIADAAWADDAASADDAPPAPDAPMVPDAPPAPDATIYPQGVLCDDPIVVTPGGGTVVDTTPLYAFTAGSCSAGSNVGKEARLSFDLGANPRDLTVTATVDESADPPLDLVLYARTDCAKPSTEVACIDAGWSERLEVLGQTGVVTVFVDATAQHAGATEGTATITTSVRDVVATDASCDPTGVTNRCERGARCVSSTCVADSAALECSEATTLDLSGGSASVTATTYGYAADWYTGSCGYAPTGQPEHVYTFTTAGPVDLVASTDDPATNFDTYVYLRSATCDGTEVACADDVDLTNHNLTSTLSVSALPAGTYYLFVDGSSPSPGTGTYQLTVTATP